MKTILYLYLLVILAGQILYAQNSENTSAKNTSSSVNNELKIKRKNAGNAARANDLTTAINIYKEIVVSGNGTAMDYNSLAWNYLLTKQYSKAMECLNIASSLNDKDLYIKGNFAHAYLLMGEVEKAKEIYIKYKGQQIDESMSWAQMIDIDFQEFKLKGINSVYFETILDSLK